MTTFQAFGKYLCFFGGEWWSNDARAVHLAKFDGQWIAEVRWAPDDRFMSEIGATAEEAISKLEVSFAQRFSSLLAWEAAAKEAREFVSNRTKTGGAK
jgi:hypothetical protein